MCQGADKKDGGLGDGDHLQPSPLQRGTSDLAPTARKCWKRKTPSSSDYTEESEGEGEDRHTYSGLFYKGYFILANKILVLLKAYKNSHHFQFD